MCRTKIVMYCLFLNVFSLNHALAEDAFERFQKSSSSAPGISDEMKRKTFDVERTKQVNQISLDGKKANVVSEDNKQAHRLTEAEKNKELSEPDSKEREAIPDKNAADLKLSKSTEESRYIKKEKEQDSPSNPSTAPISVKSDQPLEELIFPGK